MKHHILSLTITVELEDGINIYDHIREIVVNSETILDYDIDFIESKGVE